MGAKWQVDYTDDFGNWWDALTVEVQEKLYKVVSLLEIHGPTLGYPHSSEIKGAAIAMRELRTQYDGHPYRVLYVFDPYRSAVLLIGGDKIGDDHWYERMVPLAERIYQEYLKELKEEKS